MILTRSSHDPRPHRLRTGIEIVLGERELGEALVPMPIVQRGSVRALDARSGVADR